MLFCWFSLQPWFRNHSVCILPHPGLCTTQHQQAVPEAPQLRVMITLHGELQCFYCMENISAFGEMYWFNYGEKKTLHFPSIIFQYTFEVCCVRMFMLKECITDLSAFWPGIGVDFPTVSDGPLWSVLYLQDTATSTLGIINSRSQ